MPWEQGESISFVIRPMNLITEYVDYSLYPNRIWLKPDWASVVFEDDWGDGKCPRHLELWKLEALINIVSKLGETHVTYSDPNRLEFEDNLELSRLDQVQISSSAFLVAGQRGWAICGTGDGWCSVAGDPRIMKPFIESCGGFSQIQIAYPTPDIMLSDHVEFLCNNFKNV